MFTKRCRRFVCPGATTWSTLPWVSWCSAAVQAPVVWVASTPKPRAAPHQKTPVWRKAEHDASREPENLLMINKTTFKTFLGFIYIYIYMYIYIYIFCEHLGAVISWPLLIMIPSRLMRYTPLASRSCHVYLIRRPGSPGWQYIVFKRRQPPGLNATPNGK